MEVSLRDRLGGRRAISWQAVAIGDALIVVLATGLAVASPGGRRPIEAATEIFAITTATAVIAALYTGLAHKTLFRHRTRSPVPITVAVGFHLSIGVIFLIGFAVGAAALETTRLGGSIPSAIAVLMGGLLVCLPTSLLLDHSDRYRADRRALIEQLAEMERLRISEWSLRKALRSLASKVDSESTAVSLSERLDALELSEGPQLTTEQWWEASADHHRSGPQFGYGTTSDAPALRATSDGFSVIVVEQIARDCPSVRWLREFPTCFAHRRRFPVFASLLSMFMIWLFLTPGAPSTLAVLIGLTSALGVYVTLRSQWLGSRSVWLSLVGLLAWGCIATISWVSLLAPESVAMPLGLMLTCAALLCALGLSSWISAVVVAREKQLETLEAQLDRSQRESAARFSSLTAVVTQIADAPPFSTSAAIAACATGLQRVLRENDPRHSRRIIEWTESVVSAPGALLVQSVVARIEQAVNPWRALAEISVDCEPTELDASLTESVVAVIDEAVRNACRHGDAQTISIHVSKDESSIVRVEVIDDGVGLENAGDGVGFERFASLGTAGFEVSPRSSGAGTRVLVALDSSPASSPLG